MNRNLFLNLMLVGVFSLCALGAVAHNPRVEATNADNTSLKNQYNTYEEYLNNIDDGDYPVNAIAEFRDEMALALWTINNEAATQVELSKRLSTLRNAFTVLKARKGFKMNEASERKNIDRGFVHPGGLHTNADFERIKKQLKEGNSKVVAAYNVLKQAEYAQASCATWPVETIIRGGGNGENYMNAARGATIAYQNALRWKIDGTEANAKHAVDVLMQWARTTKLVSGDSNFALATGIYGYEFAQAAELMRDYEGWSAEDFQEFKDWMLSVWYPGCVRFLRIRNSTWENVGKWWQAPGHYWSNWGLCNVLAVMSIGVLCDDVAIYNQGISFFKYDMCGTFTEPRTSNPILNDGLTEFLGNLVVTTVDSDLETGAYGKLGQMQESGRDIGHATMAAGLAIDIAHMGWNQGDDLFAYMDHRLAAGMEYVAAQILSVPNLPWTNYHYGSSGYYYSDSRAWLMTGPALGEQIRPYWATVIGYYEGVKGVTMPFSKKVYDKMGIDGGGLGGTSGGYDHLGYSVLMNTMDGVAPAEKVPTELSPIMKYNGKTIYHNELGCLTSTYKVTQNNGLPKGTTVTLSPQLPEGTADTGKWLWNTGETSKDITITTDDSRLYRVTYTNENGVESQLVFSIAVEGDCTPELLRPYIVYDGVTYEDSTITVVYGSSLTLGEYHSIGWNDTYFWDNGSKTATITIPNITSDRTYTLHYTNFGGFVTEQKYHIHVLSCTPIIKVDGNDVSQGEQKVVVKTGQTVSISLDLPLPKQGGTYSWQEDGVEIAASDVLTIENAETSHFYTLVYTLPGGEQIVLSFSVMIAEEKDRIVETANYLIRQIDSDTYLTNSKGKEAQPTFEPLIGDAANPSGSQVWNILHTTSARYDFISMNDSLRLNASGNMITATAKPHRITFADGSDKAAFYNNSKTYWTVNKDGSINFGATETLSDFPFELIQVEYNPNAIQGVQLDRMTTSEVYDLSGRKMHEPLSRGIYIKNGMKYFVK